VDYADGLYEVVRSFTPAGEPNEATTVLSASRQKRPFHNHPFRELMRLASARTGFDNTRLVKQITPSRLTCPPLALSAPFGMLTLVVARFSLISRCTHRAHAAI
jgi:hypothetical protein